MADNSRPVEFTPKNGGALITRGSSNEVGLRNYVIKRDWRRNLDREGTREGHDYFWPALNLELGDQPLNEENKINLLFLARGPNGKTAVIAGTKNKLYRYFALENGKYVEDLEEFYYFTPTGTDTPYMALTGGDTPYLLEEDDPSPYWSEDPADYPLGGIPEYVDDNFGAWLLIGEGFSDDGRRWEAVNVGDYTVFNNGVDLPVTYWLNDFSVEPIWELREQGVASVGTIEGFAGHLMCADITMINIEHLEEIFTPIDSQGIELFATQNPPAGTIRTLNVIPGRRYDYSITTSTAYLANGSEQLVGSGEFTAAGNQVHLTNTVAGSPTGTIYLIVPEQNPLAYARVTTVAELTRIPYRELWSALDEPRRFAAVIPASITAGTRRVNLLYPVNSLESGQSITILGAGLNGGNLTANIVFYPSGTTTAIIDTPALTTATDTSLQATDMIGSNVGFDDIKHDASTILKMLTLRERLIIYRDTGIFEAAYTGDPAAPFQFRHVLDTPNSVYYRNTLLAVTVQSVTFHIYAGRNTFFRYDHTSRAPIEMPVLDWVANLFFDHVSQDQDNEIYAAENDITKEILFEFPTSGPEKGILWDYKYGTVSTTAAEYTAAATVKRPLVGVAPGPTEDWFIMARFGPALPILDEEEPGPNIAQVLLYGRTDVPQAQWDDASAYYLRLGETYDATLKSGLGGFQGIDPEKRLTAYVPVLASPSPECPVTVTLFGAQNPNQTPATLGVRTLADPTNENLIPTHFLRHFYQDQLVVTVDEIPCEIVARQFRTGPVNSKSWPRRRSG